MAINDNTKFFLQQNSLDRNNHLTIINNSFSQLVSFASSSSESSSTYGYIYRPSLRLQFKPFLSSTTEEKFFYPSSLVVMKANDYVCDIFDNRISVYDYYSSSSDSNSTYGQTQLQQMFDSTIRTSEDTRNKYNQRGIVFNQIVAYQKLIFNFNISNYTDCYVQKINVYTTDINVPLYSGQVRTNKSSQEQIVQCNLNYVSKVSQNNKIYATIYRKKSYYNNVQSTKEETIVFQFPNFKTNIVKQNYFITNLSSESSNSSDSSLQSFPKSLSQDGCDLNFYLTQNTNSESGQWTYDEDKDDMSYFSRGFESDKTGASLQKNVDGASILQTDRQQIVATRFNYDDEKTYKYFLTNKYNNSSVVKNNYVLYWDYTKKDQNGNYIVSNIQQFFNVPVLIKIQFNTWYLFDKSITHDTSVHYKYAFGFVDDYAKKSNRQILLLNLQQNKKRKFLINGQKNVADQQHSYLYGSGFPKYINNTQQFYCNVQKDVDGISSNSSNTSSSFDYNYNYKIKKYRYSQHFFSGNQDDSTIKWKQISLFQSDSQSKQYQNVRVKFSSEEESKTIFLQVADNQFNVSDVVKGQMCSYYGSDVINNKFIKITGTNSNNTYTGVSVNQQTGQFQINDSVQVRFSASTKNEDVKLYYKITGDIYDEYIEKEGDNYVVKKFSNYQIFDVKNNVKKLYLIPYTSDATSSKSIKYYSDNFYDTYRDQEGIIRKKQLSQGCISNNSSKNIEITFKDQAGNKDKIAASIYMNTIVFKTKHKNLRQASSSYDCVLYSQDNGNRQIIYRTDTETLSSVRMWNDIFYPQTHGYPKNVDGSINEQQAKKITLSSTKYDPVVQDSKGNITKDSQGRVSTVWNNSKKYPAMVSSYQDKSNKGNGLTYWIIDNTSKGDITLQFQQFHLDNISYGPPYNQMLGKDVSDTLAVYDASQNGCVSQIIDQHGNKNFVLQDTTLLKRLQRYTGYGSKTMSFDTGTVNATDSGQFTTQSFPTQRLCLIFYSDKLNQKNIETNDIASGFKIKASKLYQEYWQNFDIDINSGLIWTHLNKNFKGIQQDGQSANNLTMTYDYYNSNLKINYQQGSVIFDQKPEFDVFADYTYYDYNKNDTPPSRDFMATSADMVDYVDLNVYFVNSGTTPSKGTKVTPIYPALKPGQIQPSYQNGKIINYFSTDKDRGIIQFYHGISIGDQFSYVPRGRLFADYRYHSYKRLANDGYSDFEFNNSILVADDTNKYPDYTFGDIKIVNQGDAALQAGQIKFLARGVVQDDTVTQVLDINRPWDVQSGTGQQTYGKTGCQVKTSYTWASTCSKQQAKAILKSSTVNQFNVKQLEPKGVLYGRIVICLGGSDATDKYPVTTAGKKVFSSQISGKFYQQE